MAEFTSAGDLAAERNERLAVYDQAHPHNGNGQMVTLAEERAWRNTHAAAGTPYRKDGKIGVGLMDLSPLNYPSLEAQRIMRLAESRQWGPYVHDDFPAITRENEEWDQARENLTETFPVSDELIEQWAASREMTHTKVKSADSQYVDQWVNWGGVTVQVDPIDTQHWIRDTHDAHGASLLKGREYNRNIVEDLVAWESKHPVPDVNYYRPSTAAIEALPPYSSHPAGVDAAHGFMGLKKENAWAIGKRPAISDLLHKAKLEDKSREEIDSEILAASRRASFRLFDKSDSVYA